VHAGGSWETSNVSLGSGLNVALYQPAHARAYQKDSCKVGKASICSVEEEKAQHELQEGPAWGSAQKRNVRHDVVFKHVRGEFREKDYTTKNT